MIFFFYFFFFCFGAIVGSFLNVVSLRLNTGRSIALARSACFNCSKTLKWYELIPVFSFLALRGKCRNCKSSISYQYIFIEILTGLVLAFLAAMFSNIEGLSIYVDFFNILFYFIIFSILIVIFIYDLRHMIIPDLLSFLFSFLALGKLFLDHGLNLFQFPGLYMLIAGPLLALPFAFLWVVSRGRWIGLGDAKLALGIGWLLGISLGFTAVIFAFWIGAIISILLISIKKFGKNIFKNKLTFKSEVPFAPFLIIGLTLVFFTQFNLIHYLLNPF